MTTIDCPARTIATVTGSRSAIHREGGVVHAWDRRTNTCTVCTPAADAPLVVDGYCLAHDRHAYEAADGSLLHFFGDDPCSDMEATVTDDDTEAAQAEALITQVLVASDVDPQQAPIIALAVRNHLTANGYTIARLPW